MKAVTSTSTGPSSKPTFKDQVQTANGPSPAANDSFPTVPLAEATPINDSFLERGERSDDRSQRRLDLEEERLRLERERLEFQQQQYLGCGFTKKQCVIAGLLILVIAVVLSSVLVTINSSSPSVSPTGTPPTLNTNDALGTEMQPSMLPTTNTNIPLMLPTTSAPEQAAAPIIDQSDPPVISQTDAPVGLPSPRPRNVDQTGDPVVAPTPRPVLPTAPPTSELNPPVVNIGTNVPTPKLTPAPPTEPTGPTLASIVTNAGALETLENLITQANLLSAFEDATNWTVFAPRNIAFDELGDLANDLSTPAWSAHLTSLLTTHIVEGVFDSVAIVDATLLTALSGETLQVTADPLTVDGVFPTRTDVIASNGILHIMRDVITPAWVEMNLPMAVAPVSDFSTLVSLLSQVNLNDALAAEGPFTVFAPTNKAFEDLGEITTFCVTNSPEILSSVLQYHVVEALVPGAGVMTGDVVTLESSAISIDADALTINTDASIMTADALLANNGIVHAIDSVLVPDTVADDISSCIEVYRNT